MKIFHYYGQILLILMSLLSLQTEAQLTRKPFRIGVAGLTHTHVHWILGRAHDGDIEIVGIAEPNTALAERFLKQHNLPLTLLYSSLEDMLDKTTPEAVTAFGSIFEHLKVVQACAPRKIHVMVEKPLAVSLDHAQQMQRLARLNNIQLLTNYETTWYGSNLKVNEVCHTSQFGEIRKVVVHDGHQGPKEIGVNQEFLDWLTDPVLNGGGALMDFGCYGANLVTWLMKGERPLSVSAITQQFKPLVYPKVEDESTIVVTYPGAQAIIQASWNWPFGRKDMEVYGERAYILADKQGSRFKWQADQPEQFEKGAVIQKPYDNPFSYLAAVVRGEIVVNTTDLSSLDNNMTVMEILDAAKISAKEGRAVYLKK